MPTRLAGLLAPCTIDEFFGRYRDQESFVLHRDEPDRYADVLDLAAVESFIFEANPRAQQLQVLREGHLDRSEYLYPSGLVDAVAVGRLFEGGCSIVLPQAHLFLAPLGYLVRGLEAELGCRVQANVYLSPPGESSFKAHFDAHDVLVVQAHGSKRWTLYDGPEGIPAARRFDPEVHQAGEVDETFTLQQGDLAYLPRGLMHQAAAEGTSLHVTVGIHWVTLFDVLQVAVRSVRERPEARRSAPHGWWATTEVRDDALDLVRELLPEVAEEDVLLGALDRIRDELVSTRQPLLPGQLGQLGRLEEVDLETVVAPRDPMLWELRTDAEHALLSCFGTEIAFPVSSAGPLSTLLTSGPEGVVVGDIGPDLDDDGKLVLVRRLIREGLLTARW